MIVADFSLQDKLGKVQFFEVTFLLANTSMDMVLGKSLFTLSDADIRFAERNLVWRRYTATEAIPTTKVTNINDKKFAAEALI